MVNWKLRSKIYHMNTPDPGDSLEQEEIIEEWNEKDIIQKAKEYHEVQTKELYYPAKSYAVAVTYAILLKKYFGGTIYEYLKDEELLAGNDPYFVPYDQSKELYDAIIPEYENLFKENAFSCTENYNLTVEYFHKEFLLHNETRHLIAA